VPSFAGKHFTVRAGRFPRISPSGEFFLNNGDIYTIIMNMQPSSPPSSAPLDWESWKAFLQSAFGITLTPEQMSLFARLLEELLSWNEKMNLVSVRSADEVLWRHFADSLAVLPLIGKLSPDAGLAVADIGTGAGFPGIPLKIVRPDISLTLVESITKKTAFLEHIVKTLALPAVRIVNDRAEKLGQDTDFRERYDIVLSRAVAKFVGETNLSQGRILGADAGSIHVESPIGVLVAAPDQTFAPEAGREVWVSIRPECLRATPSPTSASSPNVLRGRLRETTATTPITSFWDVPPHAGFG
jgi:16S rRNA (guanine(527)-N(7))-methyltransferase RsmG